MEKFLFRLFFCRFIVSISIFLVPLHAMEELEEPKPMDVDHPSIERPHVVAEILAKYAPLGGNKYANLCVLQQKIVSDQKLESSLTDLGLSVAVPEFRIITDTQGKEIIKQQGIDLDAEWENVCKATTQAEFIAGAEELSELIKQLASKKQLRPHQKSEVPTNWQESQEPEELQKHSVKRPRQYSESEESISAKIQKLEPKFSSEVQAFLDKSKSQGWSLIVRSTSKEDTDEQSNAGANESIPFVQPNEEDVLIAVNKVIASYFSAKSLTQRSGYETLDQLKQMPPTPVLIQRMVGEIDESQQPSIGCVVYTQEAYANTPGITVIQSVLGHNKGLVDSDVQVDTYFVGENNDVYSVIANKPKRIIPKLGGQFEGLDFAENAPKIRKQPVLNSDEIAGIKLVADAIHKLYGKVMDIELVLDRHTRTIYLVQARPLKLAIMADPSYIESLEPLPTENVILGATVLPGDCAVKHITNTNQVLVASTLAAALNAYTHENFDKKSLEVVIVQEHAEPTSHAAAIFRGAGKAVIVVPDTTSIKSWLVSPNISLWVDLQRGVVVNTQTVNIKKGWFKHPIPQRVSAMPLHAGPVPPLVNDLQIDREHLETQLGAFVDTLKNADEQSANQALDSILKVIQQEQAAISDDIKTNPNLSCIAKLAERKVYFLLQTAYDKAQNIRPVLALPAQNIKRLYHINFFEALLYQHKFPGDVKAPSFIGICQRYEQEKQFIINVLQPLIEQNLISEKIISDYKIFKQLFNGHSIAFTPNLEKQWIYLVNYLTQAPEETKTKYFDVLKLVSDLGMMPSFINGYLNAFVSAGKNFTNSADAEEFLQKASSEIMQFKDFIDELGKIKQQLEIYSFSDWEKPECFEKQLGHFKKVFIPFFISKQLEDVLASKNLFAALATLSVMDIFVSVFDRSIKAIKGSTLYPNGEAIAVNFKTILHVYFDLFRHWTKYLPPLCIKYHNDWPLDKYLDSVQRQLKAMPITVDQLYSSPSFSVARASLGSTTDFGQIPLKHLEEIFTLIHQNLLIINGAIAKVIIPCKIQKPNLFAAAEQQLYSIESLWIMSLRFNGNSIVGRYNIPMLQHSAIVELTYNKNDSHIHISMMFVGIEWRTRWYNIYLAADLLCLLDENIIKEKINLNQNEVYIRYKMSEICIARISQIFYAFTNMIDGIGLDRFDPVIKLFTPLIKTLITTNNTKISHVVSTIDNLIQSNNREDIIWGLLLLEVFVNEGFTGIFAKAKDAATLRCISSDIVIKQAALKVYRALVEKKYDPAYLPATNAILAYKDNKNYIEDNKYYIMSLFQALFKVDFSYAFEKGIDLANFLIKDSDFYIQRYGLEIFQILIQHKPAYAQAIKAVELVYKSPKVYFNLSSILKICKSLVLTNEPEVLNVISTIATSALQASKSERDVYRASSFCEFSLNLFQALIEVLYKPAYPQAKEAAIYGEHNGDYTTTIAASRVKDLLASTLIETK